MKVTPYNWISLWSLRQSIAWGWYWRKERDCQESTANDWLRVFRKDEPEIEFKLAKKCPALPKELRLKK